MLRHASHFLQNTHSCSREVPLNFLHKPTVKALLVQEPPGQRDTFAVKGQTVTRNEGLCVRLLAVLCFVPVVSPGAEFHVASAEEVARAAAEAKPGDVVLMTGEYWTNQAVIFKARGTPEHPVTLRPATLGGLFLRGKSSLVIDGEYCVATGVRLEGKEGGDAIRVLGRHCRLTECSVVGGAYKYFVNVDGERNRIDHCYLAEKLSEGPTLQVQANGQPNDHQIDHNLFGHRPALGQNGGETIRVGYSQQSMNVSRTVVERNLFARCDGELEIISNKSCENIYRYNTFWDCAGTLTLRHGNRCLVEGNYFLGHHKPATGGIRVIGEDHVIINNYFDGLEHGVFFLTAGIPESPLNGYFQARNCLIAFNTAVDCKGPIIHLDAGFGTSGRALRPADITLANNLSAGRPGEKILSGQEGLGFRWLGNLADGSSTVTVPETTSAVFLRTNLHLNRDKHGIMRPDTNSPARRAAAGDFPSVRLDIDGQLRRAPFDAGCDQTDATPAINRAFGPSDAGGEIGPSWLPAPGGTRAGTAGNSKGP